MKYSLWSIVFAAGAVFGAEPQPSLTISSPMPAPEWAKLQRQLLDVQASACREFYEKYFDAAWLPAVFRALGSERRAGRCV